MICVTNGSQRTSASSSYIAGLSDPTKAGWLERAAALRDSGGLDGAVEIDLIAEAIAQGHPEAAQPSEGRAGPRCRVAQ